MGEGEVVGIHGEEVRGRTRDEERGRQVGKQISKKTHFKTIVVAPMEERATKREGGVGGRGEGGSLSLFSTNFLGEDPLMLPYTVTK